ncbi:MAG TPA: GNAT family N-acetyltransferase, partial [Bacillales bacterium]|nr:GNAT family N-acetyltransferase [Bacillales bacterium]
HDEALKAFALPEEQAQFTALPVEKLERPSDERHPIVILNRDEPVGFFVLETGERLRKYTENERALLLTALSINHSEQGKGFAKAGMRILNGFVQKEFPCVDEVVLAVNMKNIAAQKMYEKSGFQDTGRRTFGSKGEQKVLSLAP